MKVTIRQKGGMEYLYADISVSGIRVRGTIGISVPKKSWDVKNQRVKKDDETTFLVSTIKNKIFENIRTLQREGRLGKSEIRNILEKVKGETVDPVDKTNDIIELEKYAELFISRSLSTKKVGTIKQYNVTLKHIRDFQKTSRSRVLFNDVNMDFYNQFIDYCKVKLHLSTNSIGTHIKNIKAWMNSAKIEGLHNSTMYQTKAFRKVSEQADTIFLSEEEINKVIETIMPYPHLDNVRDLFVLACYTGVRIQDYGKLNSLHLINNGTMFKIRTEKTDAEVIIPVHPQARRILNKYNGQPRTISNQKFNKYIKEVCRVAKIDDLVKTTRTTGGQRTTTIEPKWKLVTSHCARRSFATNAYLAGLPTLAIMAITGHRTEKVFLKYVRVSKEEHARKSNQHEFFSNVG